MKSTIIKALIRVINFLDRNDFPQVGLQNGTNRDQWIEKTLKKIPDGLKILDVGAGELPYKKYCDHLDYTSQDFNQYDGKGDGSGFQTDEWNTSKIDIVCDITDIPVESVSFEAIMCTEVLEHLPDPISALKEFDRILKPGGYLIITAPFCSMTHFAPYHFATGFNRYFYEYWMGELAFEILELQTNGNYFEYLGQELRRVTKGC
ncbi:methylase involved in ubiquinone/menaquinone biosynthesis [Moorena producens 3L]|uniref:Methylase involved in ubiquinone/menaquinone biosynthesis n=1 Tax=Moorena producens 3L TaxID=489825 RepID=F4XQA7_9CYAN|nr:class I SAM-dependent methyltransferase [Moorena producens]EGJ33221.1 methylase involved in ubiquinone/menaquinone biosynthesis [Moorena producens 3L]OLT53571.1 ubiquinone/menaquinone biosynthesis protein [Moorena producens 3L]